MPIQLPRASQPTGPSGAPAIPPPWGERSKKTSAAEDTLVEEADPTPQHGLSAQPWFCAKILNGKKTWELRGRPSNCRARVAIAAKGTGQLWGEVNIVSSVLVARKNKKKDQKQKQNMDQKTKF